MYQKRPLDWIALNKLIAERKAYHWNTVRFVPLEPRLKLLRQTPRPTNADRVALRELETETRMDIAVARARQLAQPPVELQKAAVELPAPTPADEAIPATSPVLVEKVIGFLFGGETWS